MPLASSKLFLRRLNYYGIELELDEVETAFKAMSKKCEMLLDDYKPINQFMS